MIDYSLLETRLSRCAFGHTVHFYARCPTTQDIAHGLAATHAHGTLVVAETQTAGRGQRGRRWQTARGGSITTSFLLKPPRSLPSDAPWSLLAALAVRDALLRQAPQLGDAIQLKWPNDVVHAAPDGGLRKVAGLLWEARYAARRLGHGVLGIGINVNQTSADLPAVDAGALPPASLQTLTGRRHSRLELLISLCQALAGRLDPAAILSGRPRPWDDCLVTLGRRVSVQRPGADALAGKAVGTTDQGWLIVEDAHGTRRAVAAGDVSLGHAL